MGCDIHNYVEVRKDGKWEFYNWETKYILGKYDDGSDEINYDKYFKDPLYLGRNYDLFAILAGVRNGRGFAGCVTGMGFEPIAEPKGIPKDEKVTLHRGWVDAENYKHFKEHGKPKEWCGGVDGGITQHITQTEMDTRLKTGRSVKYCYT